MTEIQTIKRVILFKRKTRRVILEEIHNLEFKFALIKIKNELEERMTNNFEPPLLSIAAIIEPGFFVVMEPEESVQKTVSDTSFKTTFSPPLAG